MTYTCPMHPEIVRPAPGTCPKCGMALEPRVASAEAEPSHELVDMSRRLWIGLVITVPLLILAMGDFLRGRPIERLVSARVMAWTELVLATPVVV